MLRHQFAVVLMWVTLHSTLRASVRHAEVSYSDRGVRQHITIPPMLFTILLGNFVWVRFVAALDGDSIPSGLPADAVLVDDLGSDGVAAYRRGRTLWLVPDPKVMKRE